MRKKKPSSGALPPPESVAAAAKSKPKTRRRKAASKRRSSGVKAASAKPASKKKSSKRRKGHSRPRASRFAHIKGDMASLGIFMGQVAGASAIASAASGYLGPSIAIQKLGPVGDARILADAAGAAAIAYGKLGSWAPMVTNVTTGVLTSWMNEKAFAFGAKRSAPAPAPVAAPTEGLVVGNIYGDGVGNAEKRLEKKLSRLKAKADKKGIEWSDVRHSGADPAPVAPAARRGGGGRVPPAYFLRQRQWRQQHGLPTRQRAR